MFAAAHNTPWNIRPEPFAHDPGYALDVGAVVRRDLFVALPLRNRVVAAEAVPASIQEPDKRGFAACGPDRIRQAGSLDWGVFIHAPIVDTNPISARESINLTRYISK